MQLRTYKNNGIVTKYHVDDDRLRHGQYVMDFFNGEAKVTLWYLHGLLTDSSHSNNLNVTDNNPFVEDMTKEEIVNHFEALNIKCISTDKQFKNGTYVFRDNRYSQDEFAMYKTGYVRRVTYNSYHNQTFVTPSIPSVNYSNMSMSGTNRRITLNNIQVCFMSSSLLVKYLEHKFEKTRKEHASWI